MAGEVLESHLSGVASLVRRRWEVRGRAVQGVELAQVRMKQSRDVEVQADPADFRAVMHLIQKMMLQ